MKKLFITALLSLITSVSLAQTRPIYNITQSQNEIFQIAESKALQEKKILLLTFGFNECPWCQSIYTVIHGDDFKRAFPQLLNVEIAAYAKGKKVEEGLDILKKVLTKAGYEPQAVVGGFPFLVLLDLQTKKLVFSNTDTLELNTETTKGHDSAKVQAAIQDLLLKLRQIK